MASNQGRSDLENGSSSPRASGTHQNENTPRQRPLSLSAWEVLGAVSAFKYNVDRMRFYKSSISTIKFLSILNITYTVVGVVFLFLSMFPTTDMNFNHYQKQHFFRLGKPHSNQMIANYQHFFLCLFICICKRTGIFISSFRRLYINLFTSCLNHRPIGLERTTPMETRAYDSMVDIVWYPHCPSLRRSHYRTLSSWNQMAIITSCLLQFVGIFSLAPFESTVQGKIIIYIHKCCN